MAQREHNASDDLQEGETLIFIRFGGGEVRGINLFGSKCEKVIAGWRKTPQEFNKLCVSSNITTGDKIKDDMLVRISIMHGRNEKRI
jgi:hypothetical protein